MATETHGNPRLTASLYCAVRQIANVGDAGISPALKLRTIRDTCANALRQTVDCAECSGSGIGGQDEDGWLDCGCCGRYGFHSTDDGSEPVCPRSGGSDIGERGAIIRSFVAAFPGIAVPRADAPTPDHFEFIARVADALAGPNPKSTTNVEVESLPCQSVYRVAFDGRSETADDLSWAAVKSALAKVSS